tara:strand:+ start:538 stop:903 length:366 start_codon:yes stop_codon:yes gene_type:complete
MKIKFLLLLILINFNILNAKSFQGDPNIIYKNLRCLICQGQSIADSNSDFAQTLKLVVQDKIKEGKSEKEIYNFLIEKYGDWIVYKPPFNKINSALWILPYFAFILGGFLIFVLIKRAKKP